MDENLSEAYFKCLDCVYERMSYEPKAERTEFNPINLSVEDSIEYYSGLFNYWRDHSPYPRDWN